MITNKQMITEEFQKNIIDADKKIHPVESQWHYPIMTKYGFTPIDKTGVGFVRSYKYNHPTIQNIIIITTGYSCDHWEDKDGNKRGYWSELESYLKGLTDQLH